MSLYKDNDGDSPPSKRYHEEDPINVDYDDSDDDSDVIVIDTTPTMLAEKISADCDSLQDAQEHPKAAKRPRIEAEETSVPSAKDNNNCDGESKPSSKSIFEGCNSSEPIEIDDDSEDESGNYNISFENGKSNNEVAEKSQTNSPKNNDRKVSSQPAMDSANTKRKTRDSVLGKSEEKESPNSNENFHNADTSVGDDDADDDEDDDEVAIEDYDEDEDEFDDGDENEFDNEEDVEDFDEDDDDDTVPQPTEVINLADDDDDDDSITSEKESSPTVDEKGHNEVQQPAGTCETTKAGIEIIDVDEMEDIECEVEDGKQPVRDRGMDTKAEGTNKKMHSKPRFKPNKNNSARIREKEWNTVRTFRTILRHQEEEARRKATHNGSIHSDVNPPNTCSGRNFSSSKENRFIFHSSNGRPEDHHTNSFLGMNLEYAHKEQERLLNQAAQRVRNQPAFHVTNNDPIRAKTVAREITFSTVVRDVHLQYPGHFKYRDFYSRLGLPRDAKEAMVKSQYRHLARVYHPDRNIGKSDTKHKFQAVTEAYNHLMNI